MPDPEEYSPFLQRVTNVSSKNFGFVETREHLGENVAENSYQINYLIKKNDQVPADKTAQVGTVTTNQRAFEFKIIESSSDGVTNPELIQNNAGSMFGWSMPDHAQIIATCHFDLADTVSKGDPIEVRFQLSDDGGRLKVTFTDGTSDNTIVVNL